MDIKTQRAAALKEAQGIIERAKAEGRELTPDEQSITAAKVDFIKSLDAKANDERAQKSRDTLRQLAGFEVEEPGMAGTSGSWAKSVRETMSRAATGLGVKSLLSGEITVPPAAEIVPLPTTPRRLLDLIEREPMDSNTYAYLRQVLRDDNADVVADNALKPTSIYTFEEIEDKARVVAHLSEPFPLRYLEDYGAMGQILDQEMREGVLAALERQVLSGDGVGENFEGILTTTGVVQVPYTTDILTTARAARTEMENRGESPTAWVLNPNDAAALDLSRESGSTGAFLMVGGAYDVIFGEGVNRVTSTAVPQGTALLADWRLLKIGVRQSEHTLAATQAGDLFDKNQVKLRSEGRYALKKYRPQAVAVVDLTAA